VFFAWLPTQDYALYYSDVVYNELDRAPERVRRFSRQWLRKAEKLESSEEIEKLADIFIAHGAVPRSSYKDAQHAAFSAVAGAFLVSFNYRHLTRPERRVRFARACEAYGLPRLLLVSPKEIMA
jgi:hypothetical protein